MEEPAQANKKNLNRAVPVVQTLARRWEHAEDISTLLPSLKRYERNCGIASESLRERLQKLSLNVLQTETGLSRNTILRARRGQRAQPRSLQLLNARLMCESGVFHTVDRFLSGARLHFRPRPTSTRSGKTGAQDLANTLRLPPASGLDVNRAPGITAVQKRRSPQ
jgi:hypothetical protein